MSQNTTALLPPALFLWALLAIPAQGSSSEASGETQARSPWRIGVDAGAVHRFNAELDGGTDFDRSTYLVKFAATRGWGPAFRGGLSISYEYDDYNFDSSSTDDRQMPWGDIRTLGISLPLTYRASDQWSVFALPRLRYAAETGASLNDGREFGLLAGATYRVNDRLSIGPGFGVFSQIESGSDAFPILLVDWKITDTLSLETGRGLAASRGPGLTLRWAPAGNWSFGLSGRYEKRRFRLDDKGPAPNGVGEDKAIPVVLTATYAPHPRFKVSLLAGAEFSGNLRLETESGKRLVNEDYGTAAVAGAVLSFTY